MRIFQKNEFILLIVSKLNHQYSQLLVNAPLLIFSNPFLVETINFDPMASNIKIDVSKKRLQKWSDFILFYIAFLFLVFGSADTLKRHKRRSSLKQNPFFHGTRASLTSLDDLNRRHQYAEKGNTDSAKETLLQGSKSNGEFIGMKCA